MVFKERQIKFHTDKKSVSISQVILGRLEDEFSYEEIDNLINIADENVLFNYILDNIAEKFDKAPTKDDLLSGKYASIAGIYSDENDCKEGEKPTYSWVFSFTLSEDAKEMCDFLEQESDKSIDDYFAKNFVPQKKLAHVYFKLNKLSDIYKMHPSKKMTKIVNLVKYLPTEEYYLKVPIKNASAFLDFYEQEKPYSEELCEDLGELTPIFFS